ncbi:MAG: hypothetical protein ACXWCZ_07025 [Flavisolibacter sp.]
MRNDSLGQLLIVVQSTITISMTRMWSCNFGTTIQRFYFIRHSEEKKIPPRLTIYRTLARTEKDGL